MLILVTMVSGKAVTSYYKEGTNHAASLLTQVQNHPIHQVPPSHLQRRRWVALCCSDCSLLHQERVSSPQPSSTITCSQHMLRHI